MLPRPLSFSFRSPCSHNSLTSFPPPNMFTQSSASSIHPHRHPICRPPPLPSSPPSVHLSTLIPLPLSLFLQHLHHFDSLSLFPPPPFLVLFATPLFGPDAELTAAEFAQTCWTPRNREGKPAWSFFCWQNRNSGIIFFQSEIKQRSSYKHAADQRESKYSPECVSIVYRALFHSVLWWKSGASAVCRCRKRHFTPLHTHVATHVHAEGVTAVLRCTVTAAVEGKREGKTRGGVFSDLLLLGKEWCHVDLILHKLLEQIKTTIIQKSVDVVSMRMVK